MNQTAAILSTYSADVFGACSALYELGGMVVIHDPSGCNSTYTTHDEPRWYDHESLIFISALSEEDAVLGRDERLIEEVAETARSLRPRFIALVPSQIPYLIGTDLTAVARLIEKRTGLTTFALPTSNMRYYTYGVSLALEKLARLAIEKNDGRPRPPRGKRPRVNLLGVTPLDLGQGGSLPYLRGWLEENDLELAACWAMGSTLDELIASAPTADASLVLSYGGLAAARALQKAYGTPIVAGLPVGALKEPLADALRSPSAPFAAPYLTQEKNVCKKFKLSPRKPSHAADFCQPPRQKAQASVTRPCGARTSSVTLRVPPSPEGKASNLALTKSLGNSYIIGESVAAHSLAYALREARQGDYRPIIPVDTDAALTGEAALQLTDEVDLIPLLKDAAELIADPLYQAIAPAAAFHPLPHTALSGRLYGEKNDLIGEAEALVKSCFPLLKSTAWLAFDISKRR